MTCSCNNENAFKIVLYEMLPFFGLTTIETSGLESLNRDLNIFLHLRLKRFLLTALPYFFDTEKAIDASSSFKYVKTIGWAENEFPDKIIWENLDEDTE